VKVENASINFLYYSGVNAEQFQNELSKPMDNIAAAAFGHERVFT
jgi:hypothetical protein